MSDTTQRIIYGMLTALGLGLTVPLAVKVRFWEAAAVAAEPVWLDPSDLGLVALALIGFLLATLTLYGALSAGYPRIWRPRLNGAPHCRRCGREVGQGVRLCPDCGQRFTW